MFKWKIRGVYIKLKLKGEGFLILNLNVFHAYSEDHVVYGST